LPEAELEDHVLAVAEAIAANAPLTVGSVKKCVLESISAVEPDIETCQRMIDTCFTSSDYVEGRRAFLQKRRPKFEGR
jgi:enoyl-CoA hydratase/carnithine racemase